MPASRSPTLARAVWLFGAVLGCGASGADRPEAPDGASGSGGAAAGSGVAGSSAGSGNKSGAEAGGANAGSGSAGSAGGAAGGKNGVAGGNGGGTENGGGAASGPISCRARGDGKSTITLINHCAEPVSFRGSDIEGGDLSPGQHACRDVADATTLLPAIRFWGFIGADPGGEKHTLAELTLNTDFNDFDWYNISHVDAHNLPMQVSAVEMPECRTLTCANSLLSGCPAEGQLEDAGGQLISCFSPNRDDPNSAVAQYFEAGCADAYSWSGDDQESVVACAGEDYDVVFCP